MVLAREDFKNTWLTCPSIEEQKIISNFLDHEIGKIDALILEQEKLIELLKEQRKAVITHTVTKGLDQRVKMKDSGIEWLGEVPEHWKVLPLKRFFQLVVDIAPKENDCELLSLYTDIGVRPRKDLEARGNRSTTTDGYFKVSKGDIVVNKLLAWMGAIGVSEYDGVTSPAYDILRAKQPLSPHYYDYLFRCGILFTEFKRYSRGIMDMRLRLYFEEFGQFLIPFPSYEEQLKIVDVLNEKLSKFDLLREQATKAINLLEERRSALISAAVTGQIDVRNYQPKDVA
jgi:type I restriction enzyme S subunit